MDTLAQNTILACRQVTRMLEVSVRRWTSTCPRGRQRLTEWSAELLRSREVLMYIGWSCMVDRDRVVWRRLLPIITNTQHIRLQL